MTKQLIAFIGAVIIGVAIYGAYQYPTAPEVVQVVGTSTSGSTFSNEKFAGIAVNLAAPGANATSSSILNTDANDRYVTVMRAACEGIGTSKTAYTGAGLAALTMTVSTTSTAAPASAGANLIGGGAITIGTSTTQFTTATSTSNSPNIYIIWPAGSYVTFTTNATNTAVCTFGAEYVAS